MVKKFTYEDHQKKMREALAPLPPVSPLAERIRRAIRRRGLPKVPRI